MQIVNIHEAKTNLSKLVEKIQNGEEIIIAKAGKPVAQLVSYNSFKKTANFQFADELNLICHSCLGKKPRTLVRGECHKEKLKPRKLGLLKGKITIPDNFNDEDEELNKLFYGGELFPKK